MKKMIVILCLFLFNFSIRAQQKEQEIINLDLTEPSEEITDEDIQKFLDSENDADQYWKD